MGVVCQGAVDVGMYRFVDVCDAGSTIEDVNSAKGIDDGQSPLLG